MAQPTRAAQIKTLAQQPEKRVVVIDPFQREQQVTLVAVYARVSTDSEDQANSLAAQTSHYRKLVKAQENWRLVDIYADEGITGTTTDKRDEFHRLMADCRKKRIHRVLVKSVSRFCRNTVDSIQAVRELTTLGVSVFFEKEHIDTANMPGEILLTTMSHFAQAESISLSENMRRSARMRMEMGTYVNPHTPYGYEYLDGQLVVNEAQAEVVRWIFNQYLSGMGTYRIVMALNLKGIPRADGIPEWNAHSVSYILTNEKYVGDNLCQKFYKTETLPFKKRPNRGEKDQFLIEDMHVPIIDRATYNRVQKRLTTKGAAKRGPRKNQPSYPFSRLVYCGNCGSTYRRKPVHDKVYWVCTKGSNKGCSVCAAPRFPQAVLEDMAVRVYSKLQANQQSILAPLLEQLHTLKRTVGLNNPSVLEYNEKILQLSEQNSMLAGLVAKGIMDSALAIPQINENERQIRDIKARKTELTHNGELDTLIEASSQLVAILEGTAAPHCFDEGLFRSVVRRVTINSRDMVTIRLLNGLEIQEAPDWTVIERKTTATSPSATQWCEGKMPSHPLKPQRYRKSSRCTWRANPMPVLRNSCPAAASHTIPPHHGTKIW